MAEKFKLNSQGTGSYGEGTAFQALEYLKNLRQQLDSGKIEVNEFLKLGKEAAKTGAQSIYAAANSGSKGASMVTPLVGQFEQLGFRINNGATGETEPVLPAEYQQKLREELLPKNLSPEERNSLINEIPTDIGFDTDRFDIEREGIRQSLQTKQANETAKTDRATRLNDLATLLAQRDQRRFNESVPQIAEDANTKGIFRSTGYGTALAKENARLAAESADVLATQGLADRDTDIGATLDALKGKQEFQSSGLDRKFSLDDYSKQFADSLKIAEMSTPKPRGKTNGEKWAQGIGAAAQVGSTAASAYTAGKKPPTGTTGGGK